MQNVSTYVLAARPPGKQGENMHILISNDDGFRAPGIRALALALKQQHRVTMVAPLEEQSGVGHGFTFLKPLTARRVDAELGLTDMKAYAVAGTPADCVKLGCYHLDAQDKPDVVIAGINRGANLGTDVLYSGTVSAAMEGAILGLPALAVSSCAPEPSHYDAAAAYVLKVLDYMAAYPLPAQMILNVNVPDLPCEQIRGMTRSRLALRHYDNQYEPRMDPRGRPYFWLSDGLCPACQPGTDEYWVDQGYVSITPIHTDRTAYDYLEDMEQQQAFNPPADGGK